MSNSGDSAPVAVLDASHDESCSTSALLQYYDECAAFYDQSDEGEVDSYQCIDRVAASLLRAYQRVPHQPRAVKPYSEAIVVVPSPSPSPPVAVSSPTEVDSSSASATPEPSPAASTDVETPSPRSASASRADFSSSPNLAATAPVAPVLRILDLGVGTGLASRPLFANFSEPRMHVPRRSTPNEPKLAVPVGTLVPEIWGIDLSPNMLKVSAVLPFTHLIAGNLNERLSADPASPLARLPPGYFDIVCCVGTTEFVRDFGLFFDQVAEFLAPGGTFCGTFPSNQTKTYPAMSFTSVDELMRLAEERAMRVVEVQQYRGWSVSEDEHVEYIQLMATRNR